MSAHKSRSPRPRRRLRSTPLIVLTLCCSFAFAAVVTTAFADHYHVNCVGHGFVHGDNTTDGSFFARVEYGCGTGTRYCAIYNYGSFKGDQLVGGSTTCNLWSQSLGSYAECGSTAHVGYGGVFDTHVHKAHNWCG